MHVDRFLKTIAEEIPSANILTEELDLLAHGTDASFYRLIPEVVIKARHEADIQKILKTCNDFKKPVTFRTAGTSLSGQAITNSVLVKLGHHWNGHKIHEEGKKITLQPGVIGSNANKYLAEYGRKIGPDPASIDTAMIGGIVANNASGMCCGTSQNSYKTVDSMRLIMADGTVLDTAVEESVKAFKEQKKELLEALSRIRHEIMHDETLKALIKKKYKIKNTTGYGLNSFTDFSDPIDILVHLLVGSEGTLAFISEVTFFTVPEPKFKSCALVIFPNVKAACDATVKLRSMDVAAVELMDEASLRSAASLNLIDEEINEGMTALLVDVRSGSEEELKQKEDDVKKVIDVKVEFNSHPETYARLWKVRKGLFPIVGANRKTGTTVIIEDVCFPIENLAEGTLSLQKLLKEYAYDEAIIFGHALDGNLHFVFTQDFNDPNEVARYRKFMDALSTLVAKDFEGSLKAEHGTGRNMAPYVEEEWGSRAYTIMKKVKEIFDPEKLLNPDVIICDQQDIHVNNLKPLPEADEIVDKCIECGFCEPVCPSKNLTLSPRQRIAVYREINRKKVSGENLSKWLKKFEYSGEQTCAADGMCGTRCPVNIDTGKLIKKYRAKTVSQFKKKVAAVTAKNFSATVSASKIGMKLGKLAGKTYPRTAGTVKRLKTIGTEKVLYFSSCVHRVFEPSGAKPLGSVIESLLGKLDCEVVELKKSKSLCCGLPYSSKGFEETADDKLNELLLEMTCSGVETIICDNSPCCQRIIEQAVKMNLIVEDAVSFFSKRLGNLQIKKKSEKSVVFPVCSLKKSGLDSQFLAIAKACLNNFVVPEEIACCGFAGDRGFSHPELTASSLAPLKEFSKNCSSGYSSSRTCEIGLSQHSGLRFDSILSLLDECSG